MSNPIFTIIFDDKTSFVGGDSYIDTKWKEIPNKKIRTLFYKMPSGDFIGLRGYEKYYHIVEATIDLNGINAGKKNIEYLYIIGKKDKDVVIYKINYLNGNIEIKHLDESNEWVQKLNPQGWK
jgi:hypothetical protein